VSWDDAKEYIAWLTRITGKEYRLLTEAEWEYPARRPPIPGVTKSGKVTPTVMVVGATGTKRRHQSAHLNPNAFGLYDMHGNVYEWVEDAWHDNYSGAPVGASAWLEGADASERVLRGSSWFGSPQSLRAAYRFGDFSYVRYSYFGIRLARTLNA
jgi:formylglycine-generating enzyme required for sulfatase activity